MTCPDRSDSPRPRRRQVPLARWLDLLGKLLAVVASALAIWRALG